MVDGKFDARSPVEMTADDTTEVIAKEVQEVMAATPNIHQDSEWPQWKKDNWRFDYPHGCFGEISLGAINSIDDNPDPTRAYIVYVEVPPKYRKRGIATKIVSDMIAFAQSKGKTNITFKPTSTEGKLLADSFLKMKSNSEV